MPKKLNLLLVSLPFLLVMCSKEKDAEQEDRNIDMLLSSGYLCTMGQSSNNQFDTLVYYFSQGGRELQGYGAGWSNESDQVRLERNGDGTFNVVQQVPFIQAGKAYSLFGIKINAVPGNSSFPNNKYLFDFYQQEASLTTQFIIKRNPSDRERFTIESKAYPGYYLAAGKKKSQVYTEESSLIFQEVAEEFFFLQK